MVIIIIILKKGFTLQFTLSSPGEVYLEWLHWSENNMASGLPDFLHVGGERIPGQHLYEQHIHLQLCQPPP